MRCELPTWEEVYDLARGLAYRGAEDRLWPEEGEA
jgi:hypothetical protein